MENIKIVKNVRKYRFQIVIKDGLEDEIEKGIRLEMYRDKNDINNSKETQYF